MAQEEKEQQNTNQGQEQPAQTQPKGNKTPVIIVLVVIVAAALAALGFFFFRESIFSSKGLNGQVLSTDCKLKDKDLCKFVDSFKGINDMSAKSVTTFNGKKNETTIEVQGNDKSHIVSSVDGKEESNYISIGDTIYTKDYSDNKWWKTTVSAQENPSSTTDWKSEFEKSVNDNESNITYKKVGKEACGNLTCFKYQVIDPNNQDTTEYIWFDTKNYALRKTRSEAGSDVTETTFSYGSVNITEPSPVKELKNPADAYQDFMGSTLEGGAALEGLTPEQIQQLQEGASSIPAP